VNGLVSLIRHAGIVTDLPDRVDETPLSPGRQNSRNINLPVTFT